MKITPRYSTLLIILIVTVPMTFSQKVFNQTTTGNNYFAMSIGYLLILLFVAAIQALRQLKIEHAELDSQTAEYTVYHRFLKTHSRNATSPYARIFALVLVVLLLFAGALSALQLVRPFDAWVFYLAVFLIFVATFLISYLLIKELIKLHHPAIFSNKPLAAQYHHYLAG